MSTDKLDGAEDLKAFDAPEEEDFQTWEEKPAPEPVKSERKVKVQLRKFVGNNYTDDELGRLQRGEVVSVSKSKADELLTVKSSDGKYRFRKV